jgi:hypothetical protein
MKKEPKMKKEMLNLHVSPVGNDCWSGMLATPVPGDDDGPLATLSGARDAIRRWRATGGGTGGVTVQVQAGVYELSETLLFAPADSGTADAPVRYVAADGAAPVISGGRRITDWVETEHAGQRCWIAELPDVAAGRWNFTRLYVNHAARQRPRLPRTGFYHFTGLAGCSDSSDNWGQGPDRANFASGEIRRWHNLEDVELTTYQLWFDTHHRIKEIDEATGTVQFHAKSLGSLKDERGEFARYFVENVYEALDTPGQWYLDRAAGKLTYLPLPDERLETTVIIAPRLTELVRLQGEEGGRVAHVHFENLTFAHQHWELPPSVSGYIQAAWGVPGAIILEGAEACVFHGCTVAHVNGYGIEVLAGSTGNVIAASVIHDAGGGGVKIGHEQLLPHQSAVGEQMLGEVPPIATTVADCTIRDCGHIYPSAIGIWIGNSGWNRIVHNHIFNCDYTGISCGWTWGYGPTRTVANRIEHNHIHHINHREILSDNGGIYTLGIQPGTVLRGNVIHDISCYGYGAWGIYPDEGSSEMRVEQNLVYGTKKASYSTHFGRDVLVQHNIFALSQHDHLGLGARFEEHRSTVFRHNICVPANGRIQGDCNEPEYYTAEKNLFWPLDGTPLTFNKAGFEEPKLGLAELQQKGHQAGTIVADPLFADAAGGDFSLRPDSPARQIGFRPFDWRQAGPRLKAARPGSFAEYSARYPLPDLNVAVVRTQIELITPLAEVVATGRAVFCVILTNVGRAAGQGTLRLRSGPTGRAGRPDLRRLAFALEPGQSQQQEITMAVHSKATILWLDSESSGSMAVPARKLVYLPVSREWPVRGLALPEAPEGLAKALAKETPRVFHCGDRVVAKIRLGAAAHGLCLLAEFHQSPYRPVPDQPWLGTGIELLTYDPAPAGKAASVKRQLFLVPDADGTSATGLTLDAATGRAIPAEGLLVSAHPIPGGCLLAAIFPWHLLGFETRPDKFEFQMFVDATAGDGTGPIVQIPAFDLPFAGPVRQRGRLVMQEDVYRRPLPLYQELP